MASSSDSMDNTFRARVQKIFGSLSSSSSSSSSLSPPWSLTNDEVEKREWRRPSSAKDDDQTPISFSFDGLFTWSESICWVNLTEQLIDFTTVFTVTEKYEPVHAKWTTERCAICRWVEDWDYNKIVICNRCQIAVHQECYGANNVQDFTSWVCRACETPNVEKECCLCPVKGGALKPTDVDSLWVHVTCAWFRPKVAFVDAEKMEPAVGLLRIPSHSFVKIFLE